VGGGGGLSLQKQTNKQNLFSVLLCTQA